MSNTGKYKDYSVSQDNYRPYVQNSTFFTANANFVIGTDGTSNTFADPAPGCPKNFIGKYTCGSSELQKIIAIDPEAKGKVATFDCTEEAAKCKNFRLTLGDDGNLVMADSVTGKKVWETKTKKVGVPRSKWKAENSTWGTNYLTSFQYLLEGNFIGSPSGNCYLILAPNKTNGDVQLQLRYDVPSCPETGYGTDNTAIKLATIPAYKSSNIGKIGYVSEDGYLHEYPEKMLGPGPGFDLVGNFSGAGNDLAGGQSDESSVEKCKEKCLANEACGGLTYGKSPPPPPGKTFRYLKVKYPDTVTNGQCIQISQIAVYSNGKNIAPQGTTTATDTWHNLSRKDSAIDGVLQARSHPEMYHSACTFGDYWQLDLGKDYLVTSIVYYNRADCCMDRSNGMQFIMTNNSNEVVDTVTAEGWTQIQTFDLTKVVNPIIGKNCLLKTKDMFPNGMRKTDANYEMYIRNKTLTNHISCNKNYESVTLSEWQKYADTMKGDDMTMNTLCSLSAYTKNDQDKLKEKKVELDKMATELKNRITALKQTDAVLGEQLSSNGKKIKHGMNSYNNVDKERKNFKDHVELNVTGMAEDANLQMMSDMYKNILWSIAAIAVVMAAIRFVRGISQ